LRAIRIKTLDAQQVDELLPKTWQTCRPSGKISCIRVGRAN
jgi:hypothetical protein